MTQADPSTHESTLVQVMVRGSNEPHCLDRSTGWVYDVQGRCYNRGVFYLPEGDVILAPPLGEPYPESSSALLQQYGLLTAPPGAIARSVPAVPTAPDLVATPSSRPADTLAVPVPAATSVEVPAGEQKPGQIFVAMEDGVPTPTPAMSDSQPSTASTG